MIDIIAVLSFALQIAACFKARRRTVRSDDKREGVLVSQSEWDLGIWKRRTIRTERYSARKRTR